MTISWYEISTPGFIQGNLSQIQGLFKDFSWLFYSFQGLKFRKNTDQSVKYSSSKMLEWDNGENSTNNEYEIVVPLCGAAFAAPNKGTTILYWFRSLSTVLSPTENRRIQGLFMIFQYFSRKIWFSRNFQESPLNSSTFQACANPAHTIVHFHVSFYILLSKVFFLKFHDMEATCK